MNLIPDSTVSDLEAARSAHQDLAGLDIEEIRSELWLIRQELSRRIFHRIRDCAVNLWNGDYMPSKSWLLRRRNRLEAEIQRRGRR